MNSKNNSPDKKKYGWDAFSVFVSALGAIVWAFLSYGFFIGLPLMVYAFWRSRSKDIFERKKEEKAFLDLVKKLRKILSRFNENALFYEVRKCINNWLDKHRCNGSHSIVICPRCKTKIRLRKEKGESMILCPKCSTRLRRKTYKKSKI